MLYTKINIKNEMVIRIDKSYYELNGRENIASFKGSLLWSCHGVLFSSVLLIIKKKYFQNSLLRSQR